ncbi:ABC transporter permease, partial [Streptomyces sp. NPDC058469]|uniref:ABC transporter permease n=1 Tax=Streptomyces sp. NPDC058469 TaxID=3346514 RepID=UPI00365C6D2F
RGTPRAGVPSGNLGKPWAGVPSANRGNPWAVPAPEGASSDREPPVRLAWSLRRLPVAVLLGLSSLVRRPRAGAVTVLRIALPVVACTLALSTWATLNAIGGGGEGTMVQATVTVRPDPDTTPASGLPAYLALVPGVQGVYPADQFQALVPGQSATVTLRAYGTTTRPFPYTVVQGRGIRTTDEAVAGQAALDLLDAHVGQWVRLTTQGTPRILHIVGRSLDPELGGRVVSTGWDTLDRPGDPRRPAFYSLVLRSGADSSGVLRTLDDADGNLAGLDVRPALDGYTYQGGLRGSVIGLVALLTVIVASELLSVAGMGLREHRQDLGVLRALGLTPRQAASMMTVRGSALALLGVAVGVLLGLPLARRLIDAEGRAEGVGAGIARLPDPRLLVVLALVVAAGACVCALPSLRAARSPLPPRH